MLALGKAGNLVHRFLGIFFYWLSHSRTQD